MVRFFREEKKLFLAILLILALYSALFIYSSSFNVFGERYFSLFDDAMISMTYAKNFAHGDGLVWNKGGEKVEGFTNPLWVLYMALLHFLPAPLSKMSFFIQLTGAVLLLLTIVYVRKIALFISHNSSMVTGISVLFASFYYPLIYWNLMGLEVSILTLITTFSAWKSLNYLKNRNFPLVIYLILGASTLIRMDMAVPFLGIWLFFILTKPEQRLRNFLVGGFILGFFIGVQTMFRIWYFGDILPNTYYLKMTGFPILFRITRGAIVFLKFAQRMNVILLAAPFIYVLYRYDNNKGLLAWVFILQTLYSIYVGGDSWEEWGGSNRFISIAMPLYFILFANVLTPVIKTVIDLIKNTKNMNKRLQSLSIKYLFPIIVAFCLIHFNSPVLKEFFMISAPYQVGYNHEMVERALMIKSVTNSNATVAVTWAGAIPYFSERPCIDLLGKCDKFISHMDNRISLDFAKISDYKPGHMKWDYDYSIKKLRPDVVPRSWGGELDKLFAFFKENYTHITLTKNGVSYNFWILKDTVNFKWDAISISKPQQ